MPELEDIFRTTLAASLKRSTVTSCSKWALSYRYIKRVDSPAVDKWSFRNHPWLREMHDDDSEIVVGQKAAQMGYTEWMLNTTFYYLDVLGESVLYILPSDSDASDFSATRFDPALESSPHLSGMFSDVKNVGLKRAGNSSLYVRGSRSRSKLKSIPCGAIAFDEVDEMMQDNIALALERMSGQMFNRQRYVSTPTVEGFGVNKLYNRSTGGTFFFPCPRCGWQISLGTENLVITAEDLLDPRIKDSHLICTRCKGLLHHEDKPTFLAKGTHVPEYTDRPIKGYTINQLYSTVLRPSNIAASYLRALTDPADEQEFHNSKMGVVHTVKGGKITDADIDECLCTTVCGSAHIIKSRIRTMGIDVGTYLHYIILEWTIPNTSTPLDVNAISKCRILQASKTKDFTDLHNLMAEYRVHYAVIDANPERRKALEFTQGAEGFAKMCFYGNGMSGHNIKIHEELRHAITVDRTSWMDTYLSRYFNQRIAVPRDISLEFRAHHKAPVRIYRKDKDGNAVSAYVSSDDDHLAHAGVYAEMALQLATASACNSDLRGVM